MGINSTLIYNGIRPENIAIKNNYKGYVSIKNVEIIESDGLVVNYSSDSFDISPGATSDIYFNIYVPIDWFTEHVGSTGINDPYDPTFSDVELKIKVDWVVSGSEYSNEYLLRYSIISEVKIDSVVVKNIYDPNDLVEAKIYFSGHNVDNSYAIPCGLIKADGSIESISLGLNVDSKNGVAIAEFTAPDGPYGAYGMKMFVLDMNTDQIMTPWNYVNKALFIMPKVHVSLSDIDWQEVIIIYATDLDESVAKNLARFVWGDNIPNGQMMRINTNTSLSDIENIIRNKDIVLVGGPSANPITKELFEVSLDSNNNCIVTERNHQIGDGKAILVAGYEIEDTDLASVTLMKELRCLDRVLTKPQRLTEEIKRDLSQFLNLPHGRGRDLGIQSLSGLFHRFLRRRDDLYQDLSSRHLYRYRLFGGNPRVCGGRVGAHLPQEILKRLDELFSLLRALPNDLPAYHVRILFFVELD